MQLPYSLSKTLQLPINHLPALGSIVSRNLFVLISENAKPLSLKEFEPIPFSFLISLRFQYSV
jgi:hypothetical protein